MMRFLCVAALAAVTIACVGDDAAACWRRGSRNSPTCYPAPVYYPTPAPYCLPYTPAVPMPSDGGKDADPEPMGPPPPPPKAND